MFIRSIFDCIQAVSVTKIEKFEAGGRDIMHKTFFEIMMLTSQVNGWLEVFPWSFLLKTSKDIMLASDDTLFSTTAVYAPRFFLFSARLLMRTYFYAWCVCYINWIQKNYLPRPSRMKTDERINQRSRCCWGQCRMLSPHRTYHCHCRQQEFLELPLEMNLIEVVFFKSFGLFMVLM